jgi:hypothetical protein
LVVNQLLAAHELTGSPIGQLPFWGRLAVRLLPRRYVDNGLSQLVRVPRAFGVLVGHT